MRNYQGRSKRYSAEPDNAYRDLDNFAYRKNQIE